MTGVYRIFFSHDYKREKYVSGFFYQDKNTINYTCLLVCTDRKKQMELSSLGHESRELRITNSKLKNAWSFLETGNSIAYT